jgi:hypothetical protein
MALVLVEELNGGGLDGDAALAFEVHIVEHLVAEFAGTDGARFFKEPVGQRAFSVVYVRNY